MTDSAPLVLSSLRPPPHDIDFPELDPSSISKGSRGYLARGLVREATAFMGTHARSPWISAGTVLVSIHSMTPPVIEGGYRYSCRLNESLEGNRLVWQSPTAVISTFTSDVHDTLDILQDASTVLLKQIMGRRTASVTGVAGTLPDDVEDLPGSPALVAQEVRALSGLTSEMLGAIFPVARESYQRWISGRSTPATGDVRRLLTLRHLFRDLRSRVPDVRSWLLTPIDHPHSRGSTPYDLLRQGKINDVWDLIIEIPSHKSSRVYRRDDGEVVLLVERSSRSPSRRNLLGVDDLDDLSDVDKEDE